MNQGQRLGRSAITRRRGELRTSATMPGICQCQVLVTGDAHVIIMARRCLLARPYLGCTLPPGGCQINVGYTYQL